MNRLHFNIYFCGMNDETFTDQIMIYKPNNSITKTYIVEHLEKLGIFRMSELADSMKNSEMLRESLGTWGTENLGYSTIYIKYKEYLLGLKEDKAISDIFNDLNTDELEFAYFLVGGASLHNETGYRFTIHSDEKIHEHMPHVHVSKAGVDVRYSLDTLLPIDPLVNPHRRDHRKTIVPFLEKNSAQLLEMWRHNINGYHTPELAEDGSQFYRES